MLAKHAKVKAVGTIINNENFIISSHEAVGDTKRVGTKLKPKSGVSQ